jgi:hypothetical protein
MKDIKAKQKADTFIHSSFNLKEQYLMSNNNRAEWLESDETTLQGALQRKMKPMQIWKTIASLQKFSPNQI